MKTNRFLFAAIFGIALAFAGCNGNNQTNKEELAEPATEVTEEPSIAYDDEASQLTDDLTMQMVVDEEGQVVGRYVSTNDDGTYTVELQDDFDVPAEGHRVVTFTPENGQGVVFSIAEGNVNVRQQPSTDAPIIGKIQSVDGDELPETFPCLGKEGEWFKIDFEGNVGYVREDLMGWDGLDSDFWSN